MAKYNFEFKKQVIDAYLRGEGGYTYLTGKYGVTNRRQVLNWVHNYEKYGNACLCGLIRPVYRISVRPVKTVSLNVNRKILRIGGYCCHFSYIFSHNSKNIIWSSCHTLVCYR